MTGNRKIPCVEGTYMEFNPEKLGMTPNNMVGHNVYNGTLWAICRLKDDRFGDDLPYRAGIRVTKDMDPKTAERVIEDFAESVKISLLAIYRQDEEMLKHMRKPDDSND